MQQTVTFVSVGPGNPDLITMKALCRLKESDIVLVPATYSGEGKPVSRAADIINYWQLPTEIRLCPIPMERSGNEARKAYEEMCILIGQLLQQGKRVAVAVEGDISIYASMHYVVERLKAAGTAVEQTPGITSFTAAAATAQLSLASHNERLTVIPGNTDEDEMLRLLCGGHILVILKLPRCQQAVKSFISRHPEYNYHYLENVSTPDEFHCSDPHKIMQRDMPYFSILIIKEKRDRKNDYQP